MPLRCDAELPGQPAHGHRRQQAARPAAPRPAAAASASLGRDRAPPAAEPTGVPAAAAAAPHPPAAVVAAGWRGRRGDRRPTGSPAAAAPGPALGPGPGWRHQAAGRPRPQDGAGPVHRDRNRRQSRVSGLLVATLRPGIALGDASVSVLSARRRPRGLVAVVLVHRSDLRTPLAAPGHNLRLLRAWLVWLLACLLNLLVPPRQTREAPQPQALAT